MPSSSLVLVGALTPFSGIIGSLLWPIAQRRFDLSNLHSLVILVGMAAVIPAYGCLGFLPFFRGGGGEDAVGVMRFGGLTTPGEIYVLAVYFGESLCIGFVGIVRLMMLTTSSCVGSIYGAFQSYARAVYSELIPEGEEARWYGLYSITDKVSLAFCFIVTLFLMRVR